MANIKLIEKFTDELNRVYLDLKNFKLANKDIKEDIEGKIDKDYLVKKRKELVDKANDLKKEVDILLGFKNLGDGLSYWNRFKSWIKDNNPVKTCLYVILFAVVFYFVVNFLGVTLPVATLALVICIYVEQAKQSKRLDEIKNKLDKF